MADPATILTVDDNEALRYSLARTLRGEGYHVIEACSGAEAIRLAEQSPDLITLDLNLPDFDGFEVCRRLRANPATAWIPILHISASLIEPQHRVRGLDGGADGFLAQPISPDELLATVGALLRMKQAEREARLQAAEAERAKEELRRAHDELELRVHNRTAELARKNEEVRVLTGRLLKSQDDERRRLARELHDSIGQTLAGLKMTLSVIKRQGESRPDSMGSLAAEAMGMTDEMTRQVRTMSYLLHPPLLDESGLQSALSWYAEGFAVRSGVELELTIDAEFPRLRPELEIAIFRVVQESLTNIHRHSGSTSATILLASDNHHVRLEVQDDGNGVGRDSRSRLQFVPGVGIMGMQERIRQFNGTFEIAASDTGTRVIAEVPLVASDRLGR